MANLPARFGDYESVSGIVYRASLDLELDVYWPKGPESPPRPVVVFVHGGSWDTGSRGQYLFVAEALVTRGYVAVLPSYRLYPDVTFPAFVEDIAQAIAWTHANIERYGGDPSRIFLMGHSAGAHIAALVAFDEQYLDAVGGRSDWIEGFIGLAGAYDFLPLSSERLRNVFAGAQSLAATQPINFVSGGEPPALLLHGEDDATVWPRNSRRLAARIRKAGGRVDDIYYPQVDHGRIIGALSVYLRDDEPVLDDVARFIDAQGSREMAAQPQPRDTSAGA